MSKQPSPRRSGSKKNQPVTQDTGKTEVAEKQANTEVSSLDYHKQSIKELSKNVRKMSKSQDAPITITNTVVEALESYKSLLPQTAQSETYSSALQTLATYYKDVTISLDKSVRQEQLSLSSSLDELLSQPQIQSQNENGDAAISLAEFSVLEVFIKHLKTQKENIDKNKNQLEFTINKLESLLKTAQNTTLHSPITKEKKVFGVPLDVLYKIEGGNSNNFVPNFVNQACTILSKDGCQTELVFVKSNPSNSIIESWKDKIENGISLDQISDCHVVASLLKQWLSELPVPLLTNDFYTQFISVTKLKDKNDQVKRMNTYLSRLPQPNVSTLNTIVSCCSALCTANATTLLDPESLGSVLGPLILYQKSNNSRVTSIDSENSSKKFAQILIQNHKAIFSPNTTTIPAPSTTTPTTTKTTKAKIASDENNNSNNTSDNNGSLISRGQKKKDDENSSDTDNNTSNNNNSNISGSRGLRHEIKRRFTKSREREDDKNSDNNNNKDKKDNKTNNNNNNNSDKDKDDDNIMDDDEENGKGKRGKSWRKSMSIELDSMKQEFEKEVKKLKKQISLVELHKKEEKGEEDAKSEVKQVKKKTKKSEDDKNDDNKSDNKDNNKDNKNDNKDKNDKADGKNDKNENDAPKSSKKAKKVPTLKLSSSEQTPEEQSSYSKVSKFPFFSSSKKGSGTNSAYFLEDPELSTHSVSEVDDEISIDDTNMAIMTIGVLDGLATPRDSPYLFPTQSLPNTSSTPYWWLLSKILFLLEEWQWISLTNKLFTFVDVIVNIEQYQVSQVQDSLKDVVRCISSVYSNIFPFFQKSKIASNSNKLNHNLSESNSNLSATAISTLSAILSSNLIGSHDPIIELVVAELEAMKLSCKAAVTSAQAFISTTTTSSASPVPVVPSGVLSDVQSEDSGGTSATNSTTTTNQAVQTAMQVSTMKKVVLAAIAKLLLNVHSLQECIFEIIDHELETIVENEVQVAAAAIEAIFDTSNVDQIQTLRNSIVKLVQLAGLHGTIIQDEKYTFQHTTQLFSSFEKFNAALQRQQQQQQSSLLLQQSSLLLQQQQSQNSNINNSEEIISLEKEAKQLFYFLRCISVEHRVSEKISKSTIGPDKIPNLVKNLSKLLPQQTVQSVQPVQQQVQQPSFDAVDLASIIEDGRKWGSVEDSTSRKWGGISHRLRDNILTLPFLLSSCTSFHERINNIIQQTITRRSRDYAKVVVPVNAFYITQSRFTILSCLHCLVLAGLNPKQTEGPGIPSEHHVVILKRLVATHLKNTLQLLDNKKS